MLYLAANNSKVWKLRGAGYPIGWLMSPKGYRRPWRKDLQMPYALDNGLYHPFNEPPRPDSAIDDFYKMLAKAKDDINQPIFAVCPDVPYDGEASRKRSREHRQMMRDVGYAGRIAVAVQDGMNFDDLDGYDAVFVAGSTEWKWANAEAFIQEANDRGMWSHVARVNTVKRIYQCIDMHADSSDGTGMWHGGPDLHGKVCRALVEGHLFRSQTWDTPASYG